MPDVSFTNLLVVMAVAVLAPLIVGYLPRLRVPAVVLEIVGGIIIGPSVLGWVHVDLPVSILALFGLAFLLFLAGLEIDVHRLRGRLLRYAVLGYLVSLVLAYGAGASFTAIGWVSQPLLLAIVLSSTALGLVVPVLKDARQLHSEIGQTALAAAGVADFSAIVLLSLFFSSSGGSTGSRVVVLGAFAGLVAVTGLVVSGAARSMRLGQVLVRLQDTTAEIRVRFAVLLLVAFTALAERFGLESILGAFLAGAIVGLVDRDSASHPNFRVKLEAIGYGFLVPVFFVSQRDPARPDRAAAQPVRAGSGPGVPAGAAGGARPARAAPLARERPQANARPRASPGHVAAVHRDRHADRRGAGQDHSGDSRGAGVRRAAVGADLPGPRAREPAQRRARTRRSRIHRAWRGGGRTDTRTAPDVKRAHGRGTTKWRHAIYRKTKYR